MTSQDLSVGLLITDITTKFHVSGGNAFSEQNQDAYNDKWNSNFWHRESKHSMLYFPLQSRRPGPKGSMDMTMSMTGRERAEYLRWKKEREQIDEERLARHRNATGQWRREWDAQKTENMYDKKQRHLIASTCRPQTCRFRWQVQRGSKSGGRGRHARAGWQERYVAVAMVTQHIYFSSLTWWSCGLNMIWIFLQ